MQIVLTAAEYTLFQHALTLHNKQDPQNPLGNFDPQSLDPALLSAAETLTQLGLLDKHHPLATNAPQQYLRLSVAGKRAQPYVQQQQQPIDVELIRRRVSETQASTTDWFTGDEDTTHHWGIWGLRTADILIRALDAERTRTADLIARLGGQTHYESGAYTVLRIHPGTIQTSTLMSAAQWNALSQDDKLMLCDIITENLLNFLDPDAMFSDIIRRSIAEFQNLDLDDITNAA